MSNNPFAALAGDDDASDIGDAPAPKQSSKPAEAAKKTGAGSINSAPSTRRVVPGQSRPQKQVEVVSPTDTVSPSAAAGFEGERGRDDRGTGFGRGRGAGRGRGERGTGARGAGRGGRGGRPERPDRRSQTGREDSAKAEHQGWGGDDGKRELEAEVEGATDAAVEAKEGDEAKPAAAATNGDEKAAEPTTPAAPAEEEDNTLTYEEYLKQKKSAPLPGVSEVQARKANEGADESQWKDGVVHTKEEQTEYFTIEQRKQEKARKIKEKKTKELLEVEFAAPPRQERGGERGGRGGRGGRGRGDGASRGRGGERGGRGGRGRGAALRGARGGSSAAGGAKINVDDDKAFPSLA